MAHEWRPSPNLGFGTAILEQGTKQFASLKEVVNWVPLSALPPVDSLLDHAMLSSWDSVGGHLVISRHIFGGSNWQTIVVHVSLLIFVSTLCNGVH